ncbi:MAG TPA: helix-turn-helix transcriptional regulator [Ktedonobacteraceae bacterium]|nr:helix-turn-helix transcriptional regulator [Ktedonobacteraceae bacterium]
MQVLQGDARSVATCLDSNDELSIGTENYLSYVTRLLSLGQIICKQADAAAELLCKEIGLLTHGQAQLVLYNLKPADKRSLSSFPNSIGFPVQFCDQLYGTLFIKTCVEESVRPTLPLFVAQMLAQMCSCLLFLFDQSLFLHYQTQRIDDLGSVTLTRREQEILALICCGYSEKAIAETLVIAPTTVSKHRQHIYEQLGVHCERDIPLAAYKLGLFSPLRNKAY